MSTIASIIGLVATISSLLLLIAGLNAADGFNSSYAKMFGEAAIGGLDGTTETTKYFLSYDKLIMLLYLKISISGS